MAGASLIVRREVFDAVGLLDEGYFMYFEEVDFCLKASRAGWPCWYVPTSRVVHLVGQSSGVTKAGDERKRRPRYWFEARRRYFMTNHGRPKTLAADVAFALAYAILPGPPGRPAQARRRPASGCSGTSSATTSSR